MFVDEVSLEVYAGKGGDGAVHFRREKFIPKGGPDGGDGGKGGNIIFRAVHNAHTLTDYRSKKVFKAKNGTPGSKNNMTGKNGEDLILKVPVGTQIRRKDHKRILADLTKDGQEVVLAKGGQGGKGNAGFVSSVRQAPNFAEKGDEGEHLNLDLELKLVADVALVGYPSVGKSTLISVISNARPKIAEYHFTTLVPNLGVAKIDENELIVVDVPGLIEGAHEGKGLGHQFLRHIERSKFVIQMIDATSDTPLIDYETIRSELEKFSPTLAEKPFVPVFTKIDLTDEELEEFLMDEFKNKFSIQPIKISAATHEGLTEMLRYVAAHIPEEEEEAETNETILKEEKPNAADTLYQEEESDESTPVFRPAETQDPRKVIIERTPNWWTIKNERLEQIVRQTDLDNEEARHRMYDVLAKWNIPKKLERKGAKAGDKMLIGTEFWEVRL